MIDIVGVVKIDYSNPTRTRYHHACLKSLEFLKGCGEVIIYSGDVSDYGEAYMTLLEQCKQPFVLNYIEDAFMVLDDKRHLEGMLHAMNRFDCEVMRASFFDIETESVKNVSSKIVTEYGTAFRMDQKAYNQFQSAYGYRYMIGVNFITTREFALRFWSRKIKATRPHPFEMARYNPEWVHGCFIPATEVLASIDDSHGEENSCLLNRHEPKFERIYDSLIQNTTNNG
jgi:hypothetical protein